MEHLPKRLQDLCDDCIGHDINHHPNKFCSKCKQLCFVCSLPFYRCGDTMVTYHTVGGELLTKPKKACVDCCFLEIDIGEMCHENGHSCPSFGGHCAACLFLIFAAVTRGQHMTLTVSKFLLSYWIPLHSLENAQFLLEKMTFIKFIKSNPLVEKDLCLVKL